MSETPYHHYLFFDLRPSFYSLSLAKRKAYKRELSDYLLAHKQVVITSYTTIGFKADTTFMLWCRAGTPTAVQDMLHDAKYLALNQWLVLRTSLFGMVRRSQYSRPGKESDQVIRDDMERLPYFIIYPFTKTHAWHQKSFEDRLGLMKSHIKVGLQHPDIRQCLLYSYGVDDHEFIVSYETPTLEEFQDLIIELRSTEARLYTQNDLPIYTCIHKPLEELFAWL